MSKTYHTKREFERLVKELGIGAAKAAASRHPGGTHAKGLRKLSPDKIHIAADRNRFVREELPYASHPPVCQARRKTERKTNKNSIL